MAPSVQTSPGAAAQSSAPTPCSSARYSSSPPPAATVHGPSTVGNNFVVAPAGATLSTSPWVPQSGSASPPPSRSAASSWATTTPFVRVTNLANTPQEWTTTVYASGLPSDSPMSSAITPPVIAWGAVAGGGAAAALLSLIVLLVWWRCMCLRRKRHSCPGCPRQQLIDKMLSQDNEKPQPETPSFVSPGSFLSDKNPTPHSYRSIPIMVTTPEGKQERVISFPTMTTSSGSAGSEPAAVENVSGEGDRVALLVSSPSKTRRQRRPSPRPLYAGTTAASRSNTTPTQPSGTPTNRSASTPSRPARSAASLSARRPSISGRLGRLRSLKVQGGDPDADDVDADQLSIASGETAGSQYSVLSAEPHRPSTPLADEGGWARFGLTSWARPAQVQSAYAALPGMGAPAPPPRPAPPPGFLWRPVSTSRLGDQTESRAKRGFFEA